MARRSMLVDPPYTANHFACYDCRQIFPTRHSGGTGYATLSGEHTVVADRRHFVCYSCDDVRERADMAQARPGDTFFVYLSGDGEHVTTWTGGALGYVTRTRGSTSYTPSGGYFERVYVRVRALDGSHWYGQGPGRNMYVRLRKGVSNANL
ncbi:MAG: hypothetical protein ACRDZ4_10845 [Egibacteraceae bacterium]